jgi:hypothetical protein
LQNVLNLLLDRHQLFSLETIVVFLVGGSDVLELPVEILLLHDNTFGDPEVFKTLADSFFNKSLTVIKCLNKGVVSVCELALAQLENFFNWLAGHETG